MKEHRVTFTLEEKVTITEEMAPHGFIYLLLVVGKKGGSGVIPTFTGVEASTASHVALSNFTSGSPLCLAGKCQSGLKTAAPEKLESVAAVAGIPLVALF